MKDKAVRRMSGGFVDLDASGEEVVEDTKVYGFYDPEADRKRRQRRFQHRGRDRSKNY